MASIVINEISQNYTYNIGNSSYCTVALPITACWGPGYLSATDADVISPATSEDEFSDKVKWLHYPATQAGLEAFVSAYRGPSSNYKGASDYSYQMAMTLLTTGHDVLVCRLCPGTAASRNVYAGAASAGDNN